MRLFICEFITGGGLQGKDLPENLAREGQMMLTSVIADLQAAGTSDITLTCDPRLGFPVSDVRLITIDDDIYEVWKNCMVDADAALVIAPESNNILLNLIQMAEQLNCPVSGSLSGSVKTATSKLQTAQLLVRNNIPCIDTLLLKEYTIPVSQHGWVIKPDDGAGAEQCYFCADEKALDALSNSIDPEKFIIQPYIKGEAASLSMICHQGTAQLLACNQQIFNFIEGKGILQKIVVNGATEQWDAFSAIAKKIAAADHGLSGYIGVDLIINHNGITVVEINPRLTTAYVGLRLSISLNPVALMLSILETKAFRADYDIKQHLAVDIHLQ